MFPVGAAADRQEHAHPFAVSPGKALRPPAGANVYRRLIDRPELIREECLAAGLDGDSQVDPIVDRRSSVRIPDLLNEVHWLAENRGLRFLL